MNKYRQIELTEEEWIEVIKLVDERSENGFTARNKYNDLKDKMLWQFQFKESSK